MAAVEKSYQGRHRITEQGSALVYILIAIALLAALTISFMGSSNQQAQSQNSFKLVSELQSQIDFIRTSIQECVLTYQSGDVTIDNGSGGTDPGADRRYPIKPNSTHFNGATIGASSDRLVKDLRCPGNPGDDKNHVAIYGGTSAKYLPPAPALFNGWRWYNGSDGVFFYISSSKSDSYIQSALTKLNESYATCEADIIDARGGDVALDSDGDAKCNSGDVCFRVWIKANTDNAIYPSAAEKAACDTTP